MSDGRGRIASVLVAVVSDERGGGVWQPLDPAGRPAGPAEPVADLAAAMAAREAAERPRWVWATGVPLYPALLRAGVRLDRCHDVELTEALLLGHAGRWGEPRSLAAAWARLTGAPVPPDPAPRPAEPPGHGQGALFDPPSGPPGPDIEALTRVYADQLDRIAATAHPGRFRLLVAAESAGALIAAEMGAAGLPWRADVHDMILADLLGEASPVGGPPRRLAELAARIADAFGVRQLHADSPAELLKAFARAGVELPNTRAWVLRGVEHPAVPLVLEYKELYRIWTAHGWAWRDAWVSGGRFHPEYVPGGVVSGRWATRGGGALQIPKVIRRAVVADPGWAFVVADAGQLEPRVLAAVSGDERLAAAGGAGDLYAALARDAFAGDRARAKVALLGAMYGQTGGAAVPALAVLKRNYPTAFGYVEAAARTGEAGGLVRSWLGRTCPPGSVDLGDGAEVDPEAAADPQGPRARAARSRGRFTRNFVIQATAAEWAATLLATLRTALAGTGAELVFFQHDEVIVHCPAGQAEAVAAAVSASGARATGLLFGDTPVRFPLDLSIVDCYADAA
ncbi:bifunctional 3'-5' exonuclease/DNA polymerase [Micromonospora sp. DR5-3]|uniref:bifunctional 3'-5' exonuclease/DNA polymerase n=1 Tax=unclassified Micromonospora TaxID=2617518 RepID=UPI0011DB125F|nr:MULTISPECIES: bifunctional 3'-5' exonuclease/DNA polymerase [unclassified Micromonospora]MCW3819171.1 bifunctional 3'-5' exonuclease/DNA polymerase [Micromonospora sp. DR5-3]TYC21083.1 bifunctional 3'-5' exonuclease/DNA polymerase [Micromonospora sp. MP36]